MDDPMTATGVIPVWDEVRQGKRGGAARESEWRSTFRNRGIYEGAMVHTLQTVVVNFSNLCALWGRILHHMM